MTTYFHFNRTQWTALHYPFSITLTDGELELLKRINADLSFKEVAEIYLPLSCLLNFYYSSSIHRQKKQYSPYIIGIAGSVAVGKSTTACILQALLSLWPERRIVELITTDGFLYSNQILKERSLIKKKGFPTSYDVRRLVKFMIDVRSGVPNVDVPIYSHLIYDVIPNINKIILRPDILIVEGLNVLQNTIYSGLSKYNVFVSDFIDFSIYVDAPEALLKSWYINRFLKFREGAFTNPNSYFYNYIHLSKHEVIKIATLLWDNINYINLKKYILPTKERASLILIKSENHVVDHIQLRK